MHTSIPERVARRSAANYTITAGGCWETLYAAHRDGYGHVGWKDDGRWCGTQVHRAAWAFHHGSLPDGLQLDHLCRNRLCVNPAHLEPVTARVNTHRSMGLTAGPDGRPTHCRNGHEWVAEQTYWTPGGVRYCRICLRLNSARARAKTRGEA